MAEIDPKYRAQMAAMATALDEYLNGKGVRGADRKVGFTLLVYPFDHHHSDRCNYLSNGVDRSDMAALFREMAAYLEGAPDDQSGRA